MYLNDFHLVNILEGLFVKDGLLHREAENQTIKNKISVLTQICQGIWKNVGKANIMIKPPRRYFIRS